MKRIPNRIRTDGRQWLPACMLAGCLLFSMAACGEAAHVDPFVVQGETLPSQSASLRNAAGVDAAQSVVPSSDDMLEGTTVPSQSIMPTDVDGEQTKSAETEQAKDKGSTSPVSSEAVAAPNNGTQTEATTHQTESAPSVSEKTAVTSDMPSEVSPPALLVPASIRLLLVSDLHVAGAPSDQVVQLLDAIREMRDEAPDRTLVLSAGDNVDVADERTIGAINETTHRVLLDAGVFASAPGNHEMARFRKEIATSKGKDASALFELPYVCANLAWRNDGNSVFPPSRIEDVGGIRIAVVGATSEKVASDSLLGAEGPVQWLDPAQAMQSHVDAIRANDKADLIIALLHEGGSPGGTDGGHGTLYDIARSLVGVDIVMGGDQHIVAMSRVGGVIPVVMAGAYGAGYVQVDVRFGDAGKPMYDLSYVECNVE